MVSQLPDKENARAFKKHNDGGVMDDTTAASTSGTGITVEELEKQMRDAIDKLYPPILYATTEHVEPGAIFVVDETKWNPKYVVLHPDDLEKVRELVTPHRMIHVKDEPLDARRDRLLKALDKWVNPCTS